MDSFALGGMLVFGSALAYAAYLVLSAKLIKRIGSIAFTAYAMTASCLVAVIHAAGALDFSSLVLPPPVYGYALLLATLCTVLPLFMISEAVKRAGPNGTALVGALGPVVTIALAAFFLDETIVASQAAGIALVLAIRELAIAQVTALLESGKLSVITAASFPLDEIADAHVLLEDGEAIGKVVVRPAG